jgi:serine/threonine protein kinase
MTPERWQEIKGVLEQALELAPEKRSAFLDRCSPDPDVRKEVETLLLSSDDVRSSFLESSTLHVTLIPGTKLGDYEVQKLLGSGGMGEVYRARDLRLRRDVAIKVLPSFFSSDKERLRRFEQEAQAAAALNHPNILAVFQMGTYEGSPYLVSELLEGETLREEIRRGPLSARKVIEQGVQIAHGLAAAHEKGIVHRDLKPENLFTTKDGRIKILDFGLAKLKQPQPDRQHSSPTVGADGTEPGMVMGTAGYMSPEQVRGKTADHRTDIFSFGTILYEMLTGRRAFHKTTSADTMSAILNEEPRTVSQLVPNIPPALQRTIHRCLEKLPEQRFQSASDLAFALEALSDSTASPTPAILPKINPKSWRGGILTAAALVLFGPLLAWWWTPTTAPILQAVRQLTDDGASKVGGQTLITDGLRLYFTENRATMASVWQVSVNGGQSAILPTRFKNVSAAALAPDSSELLIQSGDDDSSGLWVQPLPVGEPRMLLSGGVDGADYVRDGRLVISLGPNVLITDTSGASPRQLATVPGHAIGPVVSPDGKHIRFTLAGDKGLYSIWELNTDGTGLHELFHRWSDSVGEQVGNWTPDGKYFLFQVEHAGRWDLWALPEKGSLLHRPAAPIQLTNGPLSYENPVSSRNGHQIFAVGSKKHGELVHYDVKSRRFLPYLSGISAVESRVSPDGKWIVYESYPDHALWRCRPDGSERHQLTFPPMMAYYPEISPDSTKIAFTGTTPDSLVDVYVIPMAGGAAEKIVEWGHAPAWSPDGNSLAFATLVPGTHVFQSGRWLEIHTIDLRTKQVTVLPASDNVYGPWWPRPDMIVAESFDPYGGFETYDFNSKKWTRIGKGSLFYLNWAPSPDGKYLYTLLASPAKIQRIRAEDFKFEDVGDLNDLRMVDDDTLGQASLNYWIGVAADGSPTLTRDVGSDEIYALDVKWP